MNSFTIVNYLSLKFGSTFEKVHHAAGDPYDYDYDSDEMSKASREYKPTQKDGTAKHKQVLADYVGSVKSKCTSIIQKQSSSLQTGYSSSFIISNINHNKIIKWTSEMYLNLIVRIPCLVPPYLTTINGDYSTANEKYRDVTLMPNRAL